jgi:hypothetical protein
MSNRILFWIIFFIALIKSTYFSQFGFGLLDEGESLHNATRLLQGDLPYKDFYSIFPPLDNYFFAIVFSIFGKSVFAPRLIMSLIFSFTPALLYLLISKYSQKNIALLLAVLLVFLDLNVERLYFFSPILLAIYLLNKNIFISGFLLGVASLVRVDIPGTYLVGLIFSFIFYGVSVERKAFVTSKKIFLFVVGYLIPIIAVAYWLYSKHILNLFVESIILNSISVTRFHDLPFPSLVKIIPSEFSLRALGSSYESVFAYTLIAIYVFFIIYLASNFKKMWKENHLLIGIFASGILSFPYILGRSDLGHFIKGGIPALFIVGFLLTKLPFRGLKNLTFVLIGVVISVNVIQSIWWIRFNDTILTVNGYKLRISSTPISGSTVPSAETLSQSVMFLSQAKKDEKVLSLPYHAGIYFLSNRESVGKFNNLLAGFITTESGEVEFIQQIKNSQVRYVVYAKDNGPKMELSKLNEYNPLIHDFIMSNYEILQTTQEGWLLMIRKHD